LKWLKFGQCGNPRRRGLLRIAYKNRFKGLF